MIARALAVALAAALALLAVQSYRLNSEQASHARTMATHAQAVQQQAEAARLAEVAAREEEQRRIAALKEIADEARKREAQALADAAAARDAGQRLRNQLAAFAARAGQAPGHPGAAPGGSPAGDPIGVLADVLARADERAGILAAHADAARSAGLACERAYDALMIQLSP